MDARLLIDGSWHDAATRDEVRNPWSGDLVGTVPRATPEQVATCLAAAVRGARAMEALPLHERAAILNRAADRIAADVENIAQTISAESGKPIFEARGEAGRLADLLRLSVFEGVHLRGETLPIEAQPGVQGKIGYVHRVPCGVVVGITPFNYPGLLVMHKLGPALAAGNAVILKPASQTPLTAFALARHFADAGLPPGAIQCLAGPGGSVGGALCSDDRVRKISFTGSTQAGAAIARTAGIKRLSLELGSNCPMVVMPDSDIEQVASAAAVGGYANAGQVCISLQRIIVHRRVYADFIDALKPRVESIPIGPPQNEATRLSAMISETEATRVAQWLDEAVRSGARLVTGGSRTGALVQPAIVADARREMRICQEELFGPAVALTPAETLDEAIAAANDSQYGLGASIFTRDIGAAMRFVREVQTGTVHVNWTPLWRADLMPYGGMKLSGIGREGPRYAVEEMTELKTVVWHGIA